MGSLGGRSYIGVYRDVTSLGVVASWASGAFYHIFGSVTSLCLSVCLSVCRSVSLSVRKVSEKCPKLISSLNEIKKASLKCVSSKGLGGGV